MRFLFLTVVALCVLAGALFGALNPDPVEIDFHLFATRAGLGAALLSAVFIGALAAGLLLWLAVVLPLRAQLRRLGRTVVAAAEQGAESAAP